MELREEKEEKERGRDGGGVRKRKRGHGEGDLARKGGGQEKKSVMWEKVGEKSEVKQGRRFWETKMGQRQKRKIME